VAQAMRENVANIEKLVAEKRTQAPQNMTALDDLMTYQKFAQAHVDGLKNLTAAFKSLYDAMPDVQKKQPASILASFTTLALGSAKIGFHPARLLRPIATVMNSAASSCSADQFAMAARSSPVVAG
jgi:hypothetical protein